MAIVLITPRVYGDPDQLHIGVQACRLGWTATLAAGRSGNGAGGFVVNAFGDVGIMAGFFLDVLAGLARSGKGFIASECAATTSTLRIEREHHHRAECECAGGCQ